MIFIGLIFIILLVHFLIIRPRMRRNRPQVIEPRRDYYNDDREYYGPVGTGGIGNMGRFGTFAGGLVAGAILPYLGELDLINIKSGRIWRIMK